MLMLKINQLLNIVKSLVKKYYERNRLLINVRGHNPFNGVA